MDGHWTFARSPGQGGAELLFDRSVDPGENVNLVDFAPDAARRMRALLDAHLEAQSQPDTVRSDIRIDPVLAAKLRALGYGR